VSSKTLIVQVGRRRAIGALALSSIGSLRIAGVFDRQISTDEDRVGVIAGGPWDRIVAGLPTEAVAHRILDLPFQDRRRIGQAVGPALEEHVPLSLDDGPLAWDHTGPSHSGRVLAGLAGAESIQAVLADLTAVAGVGAARRLIWTPTAIVAAYRRALGSAALFVTIDLSDEGAVVAAVSGAGLDALRVLAPCADDLMVRNVAWSLRTMAPEGARMVLGGHLAARLRPALERAMPDLRFETLPAVSPVEGLEGRDWRDTTALVGLVLAAAGEAAAPLLDFTPAGVGLLALSGFGGPAGVSGFSELAEELKPAMRWGAVAVFLGCVSLGIDYAQLLSRRNVLAARADELYAAAMPDHGGGSGRRLKMEMRLRELTSRAETAGGGAAGMTSLHLLSALSQAVPKNVDVEFDQLEHSPPSVKVTGHAGSFESVTKLQEALHRDTGFVSVEVKDVHSAVSGGGVEFVLALTTGGRNP